eukprot:TRINITY_DN24270_c0_g1_i2.p1 TRINITY_DN24270_c0_g1~~TRINITY_DN24270_c0_g1_i2.p1  ORF type:complete len:704 (+),score=106.31 TRINITY_DN24270_c0_g1_i2:43-2154(+)
MCSAQLDDVLKVIRAARYPAAFEIKWALREHGRDEHCNGAAAVFDHSLSPADFLDSSCSLLQDLHAPAASGKACFDCCRSSEAESLLTGLLSLLNNATPPAAARPRALVDGAAALEATCLVAQPPLAAHSNGSHGFSVAARRGVAAAPPFPKSVVTTSYEVSPNKKKEVAAVGDSAVAQTMVPEAGADSLGVDLQRPMHALEQSSTLGCTKHSVSSLDASDSPAHQRFVPSLSMTSATSSEHAQASLGAPDDLLSRAPKSPDSVVVISSATDRPMAALDDARSGPALTGDTRQPPLLPGFDNRSAAAVEESQLAAAVSSLSQGAHPPQQRSGRMNTPRGQITENGFSQEADAFADFRRRWGFTESAQQKEEKPTGAPSYLAQPLEKPDVARGLFGSLSSQQTPARAGSGSSTPAMAPAPALWRDSLEMRRDGQTLPEPWRDGLPMQRPRTESDSASESLRRSEASSSAVRGSSRSRRVDEMLLARQRDGAAPTGNPGLGSSTSNQTAGTMWQESPTLARIQEFRRSVLESPGGVPASERPVGRPNVSVLVAGACRGISSDAPSLASEEVDERAIGLVASLGGAAVAATVGHARRSASRNSSRRPSTDARPPIQSTGSSWTGSAVYSAAEPTRQPQSAESPAGFVVGAMRSQNVPAASLSCSREFAGHSMFETYGMAASRAPSPQKLSTAAGRRSPGWLLRDSP